ncbi:MAG: hypothetical protein ACQGVK_01880 [Myxococcota bacterium]
MTMDTEMTWRDKLLKLLADGALEGGGARLDRNRLKSVIEQIESAPDLAERLDRLCLDELGAEIRRLVDEI